MIPRDIDLTRYLDFEKDKSQSDLLVSAIHKIPWRDKEEVKIKAPENRNKRSYNFYMNPYSGSSYYTTTGISTSSTTNTTRSNSITYWTTSNYNLVLNTSTYSTYNSTSTTANIINTYGYNVEELYPSFNEQKSKYPWKSVVDVMKSIIHKIRDNMDLYKIDSSHYEKTKKLISKSETYYSTIYASKCKVDRYHSDGSIIPWAVKDDNKLHSMKFSTRIAPWFDKMEHWNYRDYIKELEEGKELDYSNWLTSGWYNVHHAREIDNNTLENDVSDQIRWNMELDSGGSFTQPIVFVS